MDTAELTHPLLRAMKAARLTPASTPMLLGTPYVPTTNADGSVTFQPVAAPTPPTNVAPTLPTGTLTFNGLTLPQKLRTAFAGPSLPSGMYAFQSSSPGAGDNATWPGNLAVPGPTGLAITTELQAGKVASGGVGCTGILTQTAPAIVDLTIMYGAIIPNLVRYGLWWPQLNSDWPNKQEFDALEGWPGASRATIHGNNPTTGATNQTVGHDLQAALAAALVWYAIRCVWVAGPSGYQATYVGPDFDHLTQVSRITAAQMAAGMGGAVIDGSPHNFDIAVEAEGPITAAQLATPVVDTIGGLALYGA